MWVKYRKKKREGKGRKRKKKKRKEKKEGRKREEEGYNFPFLDSLKCFFQYPQLCSTSHLLPVGLLF